MWYSGYNFDLAGVDEIGATPFWRAAYGGDVEAMRLLVAYGADPTIPTIKPAGRPRTGDGDRFNVQDVSGLPPVPVGGPGVTPLQAAAGVGYAEGFAANSHRYAPSGLLAAVKYLVEEAGADVNAADHEGNTALHNAAARGDIEMIIYLVSKGADVSRVNREGQTTADMANGPVQRDAALSRRAQAAREPRREEQPQVRLVLRRRETQGTKARRNKAEVRRSLSLVLAFAFAFCLDRESMVSVRLAVTVPAAPGPVVLTRDRCVGSCQGATPSSIFGLREAGLRRVRAQRESAALRAGAAAAEGDLHEGGWGRACRQPAPRLRVPQPRGQLRSGRGQGDRRRAAHGAGPRKTLLVRIPTIERDGVELTRTRVKEVLAAGADGVTLPHIRSVDEAKTALGFFQEAKANVWTPSNPTGTTIAMLMVEDPGAVAVAGQMADLKGVSVLACGIGSLTQALGGDKAAGEAGTQKVLVETKRAKLPNMLTASPQDVQQRVKEGFLGLLGQGPAADKMIKAGRLAAGRLTRPRCRASSSGICIPISLRS